MTPIVLLNQLKVFIEDETKNLLLPVAKDFSGDEQKERTPDVWLMRLPDRESGHKKAPYALLQFVTGIDEQEAAKEPESSCFIRAVFCVYSENASTGAMELLNLITRIRIALLKKRVIGNQFILQLPLEYLIYPDDTAPYFMGEMSTEWALPTIRREIAEEWKS